MARDELDAENIVQDQHPVKQGLKHPLVNMDGPMPKPKKIPICRGCSNKDWCWQ